MNKKKLIGITGGIGTGKSSVSRFWSSYFNIPMIDADGISRELMQKGEEGYETLKKRFSNRFFKNEQIDRSSLRESIFSDSTFREEINSLIHPLVLEKIKYKHAKLLDKYVIIEVPLLIEAGWEKEFEHIVVVYADEKTCSGRIMVRDNLTQSKTQSAIDSQLSITSKLMLADHVINNNGSWLNTCLEIIHLGKTL